MASHRAEVAGKTPRGLSHFGKRFRGEEVPSAATAADDAAASEVEAEEEHETLIPDPRAALRPAEHVERKLALMLGDAALPISLLRLPVSAES